MFTVKAVIQSRSQNTQRSAQDTFQLFECASMRVAPSTMASSGSPGHPTPPDPDFEATLFDEQGRVVDQLYVGPGLDHFQDIYLMNETGKTIEQVHCLPR